MVISCLDRAWHAGRSCFQDRKSNDFGIVQLEGVDDVPYTDTQYRTLARLAELVMAAWPEITPTGLPATVILLRRKTDRPGI